MKKAHFLYTGTLKIYTQSQCVYVSYHTDNICIVTDFSSQICETILVKKKSSRQYHYTY